MTRPGLAGGDDDDLRVADVVAQVARPRVADRDRRVLPDEQERRRHADDRRPTDDDRSRPSISIPDRRRISTAAWAVAGRKPS